MTTTRTTQLLALSAVLIGCELNPDMLEAGDEGSGEDTQGDGTSDGTGDGDGDGDGDEFGEPECVLQGTNLLGGTDPRDFQLPIDDCEVICADGWGHDVPLLHSEWTTEPEFIFYHRAERGALAIMPDDRPAFVLSSPDTPYQVFIVQPVGYFWESGTGSDIQGEVLELGVDEDGYMYMLWTDGVTQHLYIRQWGGTFSRKIELGPHNGYASTLAAIDDGVIVALDDGDNRLLRFDQAGDLVWERATPATSRVAVAPSGDVLALANPGMLSWTDGEGQHLGSQAVADMTEVHGLIALDDSHVVFAGAEAGPRGALRAVSSMGEDWAHSYDRADEWCAVNGDYATQERFKGVAQLGDGSLIVIGDESMGHPFANNFEWNSQAYVAHVTADGEVLAYDRGLWHGRALDVAARGDVAYVLFEDSNTARHYLRKYQF